MEDASRRCALDRARDQKDIHPHRLTFGGSEAQTIMPAAVFVAQVSDEDTDGKQPTE